MLIPLASLLLLCQEPQAPRFPDFPLQDARSYDLDLRVDLEGQRLQGSVTYGIRALAELREITMHARRSEQWSVVFTDASGEELEASWGKDTVTLALPEPAAAGTDLTLHARLAGRPVDGFYFKKSRYGKVLAFTDHYSIRARGWLPCEDHPADRARWSVRLVYPEGNEATCYGSAGALQRAAPAGYTGHRYSAAAEIPPYMFALVVGPFARVEEAGDPRLRPHLVYAEDVDKAKRSLRHHAAWLQLMEATFGPYPYAKYTTVQCPTRWGGFEAPGNVQLAESLFDRGGVGTLAHELVHMWFGDGVGYARWREVWLSEGFASYFGPWLHARAGGPTLQQSLQGMRQRWRGSFEGRTKTIRDDSFPHPDRALNSNTYPKGAWVLHMLRGELGDETFFKALREYFMRCRSTSVTTEEFVAVVADVTGSDLDWFFDQWLDRRDCPHLDVAVDGKSIVVRQGQKDAPYRFWLRLAWKDAAGKAVSRRVRVTDAVTTVDAGGEVHDLVVDPDTEFLYR